jgi:hypothetical protein
MTLPFRIRREASSPDAAEIGGGATERRDRA